MTLFISFEGTDGSGKSTQIELLRAHLESRGIHPIVTREPGGTSIGEKIRSIILDNENSKMTAEAEALLYAASRIQLVSEVIIPALEKGNVVICDRFVDSSIAYQAYGRCLGSMVAEINKYAVKAVMPDITFLIEVSPQTGKSRIDETKKDRIESEETAFHERVFQGYRALAEENKGRIVVIDGTKTIEEIHDEIASAVEKML